MPDNKKIKVLIVVNDFLVGGVQKQLTLNLPLFDRSKFDFELVTLLEIENEQNLYSSLPEWLKVHRLNFKGFFDLLGWMSFVSIVRTSRPDVVMSSLFFSNTIVRILKPFFKYQVIAREHNTYKNKNWLQVKLDTVLSKFSFRIVAVSKTVAEFTSRQAKIPIHKFEVIYNGVDVESIRKKIYSLGDKAVLKSRLGFEDSDKIIINVARLVPQKNQSLLIKSFAEFSKNNPDHKLIILGAGGLELELKKLISDLGQDGRVFLLGNKTNVADYYYISDFFVLSSEIEGFAVVCIEAMACGLPVLSTKTAGPDEYIHDGKNGFLVENSQESLVEGLNKISNTKFENLEANLEEAVSKFDIRKTAVIYQDLFKRCHEGR